MTTERETQIEVRLQELRRWAKDKTGLAEYYLARRCAEAEAERDRLKKQVEKEIRRFKRYTALEDANADLFHKKMHQKAVEENTQLRARIAELEGKD